MNHTVTPLQYWVGTGITIFTLIVGILGTYFQFSIVIEENRQQRIIDQRKQVSEVLRELTISIYEVSSQLDSHASMFLEMMTCLNAPDLIPNECQRHKYSFDPTASSKAWNQLQAVIVYSRPLFNEQKESDLLNSLSKLQTVHQNNMRKFLPPDTPEDARRIVDTIANTKIELLRIKDKITNTFNLATDGVG